MKNQTVIETTSFCPAMLNIIERFTNIKIKLMKFVIFKSKFFVQDLNAKVMSARDFNTNFFDIY